MNVPAPKHTSCCGEWVAVKHLCLSVNARKTVTLNKTKVTTVTNESKMADDELEKLRSQRMAELRSQLQVCSHLGLLATGIDVTLCVHSASGWGRER